MTVLTAAQLRAQTDRMPDPQVPERPRPPRRYPAAYKLRILGEYEQLDKAGKGALLRREACTPRCLASGASSATRARWPRSGRTDGRAAHGWIRPSGRTPGCADGSSSWKATWLARAR